MSTIGTMHDSHVSDDLTLAIIARTVHQVIRAMTREATRRPFGILLQTIPTWEELPEAVQAEACKSVTRCMVLGCDAERMHNAWREGLIAEGWGYGEILSAEEKRHPGIVEWNDLPPLTRMTDCAHAAIVEALTTPVQPVSRASRPDDVQDPEPLPPAA